MKTGAREATQGEYERREKEAADGSGNEPSGSEITEIV